ncbi:MAG: Veg family protein [Phoenicibacter congonensis]|uniref:Veg family protein n=1 Tax=Phoenicibacter congonensis TaxID=1944646 RepID=A0AA43RK78_9ACTN|nr:Veg family protein [Phoenicibacter congonensis]
MDLNEQAQLIEKIRGTFEAHLGEKVHVEQDLGRSRISTHNGTIYQVHPRLFILEVQRKRVPKARMSFQFADILTGIVKVSQNGESLFENYQDLLAVKKEVYDESEYANNDIDDEQIVS